MIRIADSLWKRSDFSYSFGALKILINGPAPASGQWSSPSFGTVSFQGCLRL